MRRIMSIPREQCFDAILPGVSQPIRITTIQDAKVFLCRWAIRDKDPALKALLRDMAKTKSAAADAVTLRQLKQALASRGLLVG